MALDLTAKNDLLRQPSQSSVQNHIPGVVGRQSILFRHFSAAARTPARSFEGVATSEKWVAVWTGKEQGDPGHNTGEPLFRCTARNQKKQRNGKLAGPPPIWFSGFPEETNSSEYLFPGPARAASRRVGTYAENSLIASYRWLPPLTALHRRQEIGQAGRQSKGPSCCSLLPVCAPSCCSRRRSPAPGQYHQQGHHPAHHTFDTHFSTKLTAAVRSSCPPASSGSIFCNRFPFHSRRSRSQPAADVKLR